LAEECGNILTDFFAAQRKVGGYREPLFSTAFSVATVGGINAVGSAGRSHHISIQLGHANEIFLIDKKELHTSITVGHIKTFLVKTVRSSFG
jgi:hypothetical protein